MEKLTSPEVMKGDLQVDVRKVEILSAKMEDKIEELWGFFSSCFTKNMRKNYSTYS